MRGGTVQKGMCGWGRGGVHVCLHASASEYTHLQAFAHSSYQMGCHCKKRDPGRGIRNPVALHMVPPRPGLRKCITCTSCFSLMANVQQSCFFLLAEK